MWCARASVGKYVCTRSVYMHVCVWVCVCNVRVFSVRVFSVRVFSVRVFSVCVFMCVCVYVCVCV